MANKKIAAVVEAPVKAPRLRKAKAVQPVEAPKAPRARKVKEIVQAVVLKNPIQIRHIRAEVQPSGKYALKGTDTVTDCGRIVVKQMTRKNPPTGKTVAVCPHCVERGHNDKAFQIVRGAVKLIAAK